MCLNVPLAALPTNPLSTTAKCTTCTSTTAAGASAAVNDHSIVLLSSDSEEEDELPPLAQRIGFATSNGLTRGNCVNQATVIDISEEKSSDTRLEHSQPMESTSLPATQLSSASRMAGMAALRRQSGCENVVVTTTVPFTSTSTKAVCDLGSQISARQPITQPR